MHLRTSLAAVAGVAAVVAAGLIGLSSSAYAGTGTVTGSFASGTATYSGATYGCTSGSVAGTYDDINNPALVISSMSISCSTPFGTSTTSLNSCTVPVSLTGTRTSGIDTAIAGNAVFGTGTCVKVSLLAGLCTFNVQGTVAATFNETTKVVGGVTYQDLILNGSGTIANQSPNCFGFYSGSFTLNNIAFNIAAAGGPINFV